MPQRANDHKRRITSLADLVTTFRACEAIPQTYEVRRRGDLVVIVLLQVRAQPSGAATGLIELRECGHQVGAVTRADIVADARAIGLDAAMVTALDLTGYRAIGMWR